MLLKPSATKSQRRSANSPNPLTSFNCLLSLRHQHATGHSLESRSQALLWYENYLVVHLKTIKHTPRVGTCDIYHCILQGMRRIVR